MAEERVDARTVGEGVDPLVTALLTASRALVAVSARSLSRAQETVTLAQFRMLVLLDSGGPMRLTGLAEELSVQPSTAVRMVDRLVAARLVRRRENSSDRREVLIALTARGQGVVDDVTQQRRAEIRAIVQAMPRRSRGQAVAALNAFTLAAGEPAPQDRAAAQLGW